MHMKKVIVICIGAFVLSLVGCQNNIATSGGVITDQTENATGQTVVDTNVEANVDASKDKTETNSQETSNYDSLQEEIDQLESEKDNLIQEHSDWQTQNTQMQSTIKDLQAQIESLQTQVNELSQMQVESDSTNSVGNGESSVLFSNLIPVSGGIEGYWESGQKDNYNNSYTSGIMMHQNYREAAHVVYALDGKYTQLTGKFVLTEESKNTDGQYVLYAYSLVDGNKNYIWESKVLGTAVRPIDIQIPVSGVMDLVLEVYDPNKTGNNATTGIVDAVLQ